MMGNERSRRERPSVAKKAGLCGSCGETFLRQRLAGPVPRDCPQCAAKRRAMPISFSARTVDKFWSQVLKGGVAKCWQWQAAFNSKGYGRFHAEGKSEFAHRYSVRLGGRDIPCGMEVDHQCGVRSCVNPDHLRVVTHRENLLSGPLGRLVRRTHCTNGHEFSAENTGWRKRKRRSGQVRYCRICDRQRQFKAYVPVAHGSRRRRAKLTRAEAERIRECLADGMSHSEIAPLFDISVGTVSRVRNGGASYGR